jgi:hypothetical protein
MVAPTRPATPAGRVRTQPALHKKNGTVTVTSSGFGVDQEDRQDIEISSFVTEPASVRISVGVTRSLDVKFEFLKLQVDIEMPCYAEEVHEVAERVANEAAAILQEELARWNLS